MPYLIIHDHELGVDIDLEAPVLLSGLVGAASRGGGSVGGLPIPVCFFVACATVSLWWPTITSS